MDFLEGSDAKGITFGEVLGPARFNLHSCLYGQEITGAMLVWSSYQEASLLQGTAQVL